MNVPVRYELPRGTELEFYSRPLVVSGDGPDGYLCHDRDTGEPRSIHYADFAAGLRAEQVRISNRKTGPDAPLVTIGRTLEFHKGSNSQQDKALFVDALCQGLEQVEGELSDEIGRLSLRMMEQPHLRRKVARIAECILGEPIDAGVDGHHRKGGCQSKVWIMPKGRTLVCSYLPQYRAHKERDARLAGQMPQHQKKGNRTPRIHSKTFEIAEKALREKYLVTSKPSISNAHDYFVSLLKKENAEREELWLKPLKSMSQAKLRKFVDVIATPTEQLVARDGMREARNKRGRGSTDIVALLPGEEGEIDEYHASLVTSAKVSGVWRTLQPKDQQALFKIDAQIRKRFVILAMIDVATRMPLAWIISDAPRATATLALMRMATRDKTREAKAAGCSGTPMPPVGLGMIVSDNGPGLNNSAVKRAQLGMLSSSTCTRAYNSSDKPFIERLFGTTESILMKILHGYTGRRPGDLPGYDAMANGVLNVDDLNRILTRFFVDIYPSMRHTGAGLWGRRPVDIHEALAKTRGYFRPLDPVARRRHLGYQVNCTPNDEGLRTFGGIYFNGDEFQRLRERHPGKVQVFVDPDNLEVATAVLPNGGGEICVYLQTTVFADATLEEAIAAIRIIRRDDPKMTDIHEERIRRAMDDIRADNEAIGAARGVGRSYSTKKDLAKLADTVFEGARVITTPALEGTLGAGQLMSSPKTLITPTPSAMNDPFAHLSQIKSALTTETVPTKSAADPDFVHPVPVAKASPSKAFQQSSSDVPTTEVSRTIYFGRPKAKE